MSPLLLTQSLFTPNITVKSKLKAKTSINADITTISIYIFTMANIIFQNNFFGALSASLCCILHTALYTGLVYYRLSHFKFGPH